MSFELTFRLRHFGGFSWTAYRAIPPKEEDFVRKSGSFADRLGASKNPKPKILNHIFGGSSSVD